MRGTFGIVFLVLMAGCVGEKVGPGSSGQPSGGVTPTVDANTTEGVLLNSPHLKILGPATVQWDLQNGTATAPEVVSTLVYIGLDAPSDHHARDNGIVFAAFIPLNATEGLQPCGEMPASVKHYMRNFGGGGNEDNVGNLTGDYARGWYHFIAIADGAASLAITFDSEKELRPRKLPAADPFVANIQWTAQTGQREYHVDVDSQSGPWFSWAQHQVGVNGGFGGGGGGGGGGSSLTQADGGRTHSLAFNGECAKVSRMSTFPTVQTQGEQHRLRTAAAGNAKATLDAVYAPQQAAAAPQTTLHLVGVAIRNVEIPAAPPAEPAT